MKNIKYSVYIPVLLALALVAGIIIGNKLNRNSGGDFQAAAKVNKFDAIVDLIQNAYVDSISTDSLVEKTIPQLLKNLDPRVHLAAGRALEPLRDEGILIIGSGMSFHNMRGYGDPRFGPIADAFDHWLVQAVTAAPEEREEALANWEEAPSARLSHPRGAEEHLLPLMVVAGAAGRDQAQQVFSDRVMETRLSAFTFG